MSKAASDEILEKDTHENSAVYRKICWRIMPFLLISGIIAYIDRGNVGFAKLQFMSELGISETAFGLGGGLCYLGYSFTGIPCNIALRRIGIKVAFLWIMGIWGICSAATAFIEGPLHYYVLRFLVGAAEGGFFPGVLFYLTRWVPARRRARFTAIFMSSIAISGIVGVPISGSIMSLFADLGGLHAWQWLFLVEGIPAFAIAIVGYYYLSESPKEARWLNSSEKTIVIRDIEKQERANGIDINQTFLQLLKTPKFYFLAGMAVPLTASAASISLWMPTMFRQAGILEYSYIGLLGALAYSIGVMFQFLVARHSDRTLERRWHAGLAAIIAVVRWTLIPAASGNAVFTAVALILAMGGNLSAMGPFWSMPAAVLSGPAVASGIALISTLSALGSFGCISFVGWINTRTGSLATGQYFLAAMVFIGVLAFLLGTRAYRNVEPIAASNDTLSG